MDWIATDLDWNGLDSDLGMRLASRSARSGFPFLVFCFVFRLGNCGRLIDFTSAPIAPFNSVSSLAPSSLNLPREKGGAGGGAAASPPMTPVFCFFLWPASSNNGTETTKLLSIHRRNNSNNRSSNSSSNNKRNSLINPSVIGSPLSEQLATIVTFINSHTWKVS